MGRINVTIDDEVSEKLAHRKKEKGTRSAAQSIREIIDLGLKAEADAIQNELSKAERQAISKLSEMVKSTLIWVLETRFLVRKIVRENLDNNKGQADQFLSQCSERALQKIEDLMGEMEK